MENNGKSPVHYVKQGSSLPFSAAVGIGDILYFSGEIGIDSEGRLPAGIVAQTHQMMDNIARTAALAGLDLSNIFKCTVMLADMAEWELFNSAYLPYFPPDRLPARSAFGTSGLAMGARVEMECLARAP